MYALITGRKSVWGVATAPYLNTTNYDNEVIRQAQMPPHTVYNRSITSLGRQGRRVFREGPKFFELCPIFLNFVQHIFLEGACPPWLRAWCTVVFPIAVVKPQKSYKK